MTMALERGRMILKLLKRAGWVTAGNIIGQALVLVATVWLARMYTPAEFGMFAVVLVISNISIALASLRFDIAIPSATDQDSDGLTVLAVLSILISATAVTGAIWAANRSGLISLPFVETHALLTFVTIVASGAFQTLNARLVRSERFKTVGLIRGAQGLTFVALASVPAIGLLWAQALSLAWGMAVFPGAVRSARRLGPTAIAAVLRRQWKLPFFSLPGAALDVIGYSMVIWVLITVYGSADAGTYSQLQRLLGGPMMLISISLGQVLLRQTVDHAGDPAALRSLLSKVLLGLGGMLLLLVAAVAVAGAPVLRLVLGEQWSVAPMMTVLITIAVGVRACVSPLSSVLVTLRHFGVGLAWQAAYFCSAAALFPMMARRLDFHGFVAFYALHEVVLYTIYFALIWRSISRKDVR